MTRSRQTALAALLLCTLGSAHALTVNHQIAFNTAPTPLKVAPVDLLLPQFDSSLGTLDSVTITLFGHVEGFAKVESTNDGAANVTFNLQATLKLVDPVSGNTLVQTTPLVSNTFMAATFDGDIDYAGTSGKTYANLAVDNNTLHTFTDVATLGQFTGLGSVITKASSKGESGYISSGNIDTLYQAKASGYASVSYAYHTTAVPEPGTWALMFAGLGMVGMLASRRRQA